MWWLFPSLRHWLSSCPDDAALSVDEVTQLERCMRLRSACPRLTFDAMAICKCKTRYELSEATQVARFIAHVNSVLQKHRGRCAVVETLEFKTDFVGGAHGLLAHHIQIWVEFAVSSRTKNLTLDLKPQPEFWWEYHGRSHILRKQDLYVFPFKQLSAVVSDNNTNWGSSLQQLHLSFVSFKPPSQFKGFPNLRKLHLEVLDIAKADLQHLLSHCASKIQWLRINRCDFGDQLTLATPLTSMLYLNVDECRFVTKIDIKAPNLATFEYGGSLVPIRLVHSLNFQRANLALAMTVFEHALISLGNCIPSVQSLTADLSLGLKYLEKQWPWDRPLPLKGFSNLRHLQLLLYFFHNEVDKFLYLSVSFLGAAPFIEKLEVHFVAGFDLWLAQGGPSREDLGQCKCKYNHLKNVRISGFQATRAQLEFLLHVIENADALEVLRVEIEPPDLFRQYKGEEPPVEEVK